MLNVSFFESKTANFIQMIFSHIVLMFFIVVVDPDLNVVSADRPDVKVLYIT